jgi:hypothetical protein
MIKLPASIAAGAIRAEPEGSFLLNAAKLCVLAKPVPALRLNAALRVAKRARNDGFPAHENSLPRQRNMTSVPHW